MDESLDRQALRNRRQRLQDVASYWRASMRDRILDLGRPGGGVERLPTQEEYDAWRLFWLAHHDGFQRDLLPGVSPAMNDWVQRPEVQRARQFLRLFVSVVNVGTFIAEATAGREIGIHGATWNVSQVDGLLARYSAELEAATSAAPGAMADGIARVAKRIDDGANWIERHPKAIVYTLVIAVVVLVLLGVVTPTLLREITDLVKTIRGL